MATEAAKKVVAENIKQRAHKEAKLKAEAEELAAKLTEIKLTVGAKTSSTGKIFGSVNNIMISEALMAQGFDIEPEKNYAERNQRSRNLYRCYQTSP